MTPRKGSISLILAVLLLLPAGVLAAAPIATIDPGNTVFLGEEGLDITAALGGATSIGWWASAANIASSSPSYTITVSSPTSFFVAPTDFMGKLGPWYRLNAAGKADGTAFLVADPSLDIRVEDATLGYDATDGWVPVGDEVQFRITTNLYQMTQRPGVSAVPMKINVRSPDGASYSALVNAAGMTTSLDTIPVSTSPYSTGPIWDTSRRDLYPFGTYRISAECNVNRIKDNYGAPGKTYTPTIGMLDQEQNPLITVNTRTTAVTTVPTTRATTVTTIPTTVTSPPTTVVTTTAAPTTVLTTVPATTATTAPAKTPGFGAALAAAGLLAALVLARKE